MQTKRNLSVAYSVETEHLLRSLRHYRDLPANGEKLILQVMTADDYGTNLGLVVHEIWWGHKDTMPGLP